MCEHTQIQATVRSLTSLHLTDAWRVLPLESDCAEGTSDLTQAVNAVPLALLGLAIDCMCPVPM